MTALHISIDGSIKNAWPATRLGCLLYTVDVRRRDDALWACLETEVSPYLKTMLEATPLAQIPNLDESRKAYKAFGKDPGRFRVSSEALYRRVRQGKELYQINTVVDANNLVSLETGFSLGSYDTARIGEDIVFRLGEAGELYPGIGKSDIDLERMPLLADAEGAFGSPTSDSTRAMITPEAKRCLTVVFSFSAKERLDEALALTVKRFEAYVGIADVETFIVE